MNSIFIIVVVNFQRWGRGHPEQYTEAIHLGDERFDSLDSDKKPRAGQILWIRGLTRLQTQVNLRCNELNKYFSVQKHKTPKKCVFFSLNSSLLKCISCIFIFFL